MIKNEVMHKIMKDMVMYLTPYQLKKLKTTLQDKLENVEINLILDKEKLIADRSSNDKLLIFIDEYVANCIQKSDFNLRDFAKKKTAIYVLLPDDRETYHKLRKFVGTTNIYLTC